MKKTKPKNLREEFIEGVEKSRYDNYNQSPEGNISKKNVLLGKLLDNSLPETPSGNNINEELANTKGDNPFDNLIKELEDELQTHKKEMIASKMSSDHSLIVSRYHKLYGSLRTAKQCKKIHEEEIGKCEGIWFKKYRDTVSNYLTSDWKIKDLKKEIKQKVQKLLNEFEDSETFKYSPSTIKFVINKHFGGQDENWRYA